MATVGTLAEFQDAHETAQDELLTALQQIDADALATSDDEGTPPEPVKPWPTPNKAPSPEQTTAAQQAMADLALILEAVSPAGTILGDHVRTAIASVTKALAEPIKWTPKRIRLFVGDEPLDLAIADAVDLAFRENTVKASVELAAHLRDSLGCAGLTVMQARELLHERLQALGADLNDIRRMTLISLKLDGNPAGAASAALKGRMPVEDVHAMVKEWRVMLERGREAAKAPPR